ncbi:hypothetical protein E2553_36105 [Paraburkholderia dipogonis]|uniref:Uncharacterized protein n=1 Tax=Paraburkholderia dipogonis TaxID=1211383 RepID=A0A4Y8MXG7_9BURK|nr:hypothetical protein [Paraburkholderia dipogonis]TFE42038.1 hypothetical protein E2553_36105 [Paraburkholderia dipogonis]
MNDIGFADHEETLEFAMIAAVNLIADMDESLPDGSATVVPEHILQALDKSAPLLMSEVTQYGLWGELLSHIGDYGLLRQLVADWVDLEGFLDCGRRVFFEDLLYALEAENWKTSRPTFHALFLSIVPVIRPRLEAMYAIPW